MSDTPENPPENPEPTPEEIAAAWAEENVRREAEQEAATPPPTL